MPKSKPLTPSNFASLVPKLKASLTTALEKERNDSALPDEGGSDLWELPPVDSKAVAKLSPLVNKLTGWRLDPKWIRKGGYPSVEAAVDDLLVQLRKHCVSEAPSHSVSNALAVTLTS